MPSDRRRLAQNIIGFIEAVGVSLTELNEILKKEKQNGQGTLTRNLSPYLIVVQSIFNRYPEKIVNYLQDGNNKNKQKILITSEMTVPELGEIIYEKLVRI